jgi:hypothetical protein
VCTFAEAPSLTTSTSSLLLTALKGKIKVQMNLKK